MLVRRRLYYDSDEARVPQQPRLPLDEPLPVETGEVSRKRLLSMKVVDFNVPAEVTPAVCPQETIPAGLEEATRLTFSLTMLVDPFDTVTLQTNLPAYRMDGSYASRSAFYTALAKNIGDTMDLASSKSGDTYFRTPRYGVDPQTIFNILPGSSGDITIEASADHHFSNGRMGAFHITVTDADSGDELSLRFLFTQSADSVASALGFVPGVDTPASTTVSGVTYNRPVPARAEQFYGLRNVDVIIASLNTPIICRVFTTLTGTHLIEQETDVENTILDIEDPPMANATEYIELACGEGDPVSKVCGRPIQLVIEALTYDEARTPLARQAQHI